MIDDRQIDVHAVSMHAYRMSHNLHNYTYCLLYCKILQMYQHCLSTSTGTEFNTNKVRTGYALDSFLTAQRRQQAVPKLNQERLDRSCPLSNTVAQYS